MSLRGRVPADSLRTFYGAEGDFELRGALASEPAEELRRLLKAHGLRGVAWPELRGEGINAQEVAALPRREALSLVNANLALPSNAALAANVLSDNALAGAAATQATPIVQGMFGTLPAPNNNH